MDVTHETHPVYKGPHNSDRHVAFLEILFPNIYMCAFAGIASGENNARSSTLMSILGSFLLIRYYWRIPILVSHPPLTYMLKFSRLFCLISWSCGSPGNSMHNNASSKLHTLWQQGLTQQALRLTAQSTYFQIETIMLKCENADTSMPSGVPQEHGCVQWSIDSRNSAIHNGYCTSLHPSSSCEPRHLLLNLYMKNTSRPQISQC